MTDNTDFITTLESKLYNELLTAGRVITLVVDVTSGDFVTTIESVSGEILATGRAYTPLNSLLKALQQPPSA